MGIFLKGHRKPSGEEVEVESVFSAVVRGPYSFDYTDLPALADGVAVYTPTVDDILLDAWFEINEVFNNDAKADISQYTGSGLPYGLFGYLTHPCDLRNLADTLDQGGGPLQGALASSYSLGQAGPVAGNSAARLSPARFITNDPLLLVVSQDGQKGGAVSVANAGAARLYLITATPIAL